MATAKKLFERSPLDSMIVCEMSGFKTLDSMKLLLKRLTFLKVMHATTGHKAFLQFSSFIQTCLRTEPEKIKLLSQANKDWMISFSRN